MFKYLTIILFFSSSLVSFSQFYAFDSIPSDLRKGADAIIRSDQCLFTVKDPGNAVVKRKFAVTLINDDALPFRRLQVNYNKFSRINYITGTVYDEKGKIVKKTGAQDIHDMSMIFGADFYRDDRMKVVYFPRYRYPYTIEYEYEISYSGLLQYPEWHFQVSPDVSVEESGIQFVMPAEMKLRYIEKNLKNKADSVIDDEKKIYTWKETGIRAFSSVNSLVTAGYKEPVLNTAPLDFEKGGYKGSLRSWKEFGQWFYELNANRDKLPASEVAIIDSLSAKYNDKKELAKAVYEYMQSKTRYVSIQIGIGGFQTAEASQVSKSGFGDCKALVNYTKALLKEAGIESFFALAYANSNLNDINTSFVANTFNHVILCVPFQKDTVWLECTSQTLPFNYLGTFTSARHVLLITPEGGQLTRTPEIPKEKNMIRQTASVTISPLGTSSATFETEYTGFFFDKMNQSMALQSEGELKKTLYSSITLPDFSVLSVKYDETRSEIPSAKLQCRLNIEGLGITAGSRIYFSPSLSKEELLPPMPLYLRIPFSSVTIDSLVFNIPPGYAVESLPEPVITSNEFGSCSTSVTVSRGQIIFYRTLDLNKGIIEPEKYDAFRNFYNKAFNSDREIIVLAKRTNP